MILPQDIKSYLKAEPFRPFRLHMASGQTFDIRHPEMVRPGKTLLIIFTFVSDDPELFDRWESVSLMLIERISFLDSTVSQS